MNNEKMQALADYLSADEARTVALAQMEPDEMLRTIRAAGIDITSEEMDIFAKELLTVSVCSGSGELSEDDLDEVSGGILMTTLCGILFGCVCVSCGCDLANSWLKRRRR